MPLTTHHLISLAIFVLGSWFGAAGTPVSAQIETQSLAPTMKQAAARVAIQMADLASAQANPIGVVLLVPSWQESLLGAHELLREHTKGQQSGLKFVSFRSAQRSSRGPRWSQCRRGRRITITGDAVVSELRSVLAQEGLRVLLPHEIVSGSLDNIEFDEVLSFDLRVAAAGRRDGKVQPVIFARSYLGDRVGAAVSCAFPIGEAEWVDSPGKNLVTVAGPPRADPRKALKEAHEMLLARYASHAGVSRRDPALQAISWKQNLQTRSFLATIDAENGELYQAYLGAEAKAFDLHHLRSEVRNWHRWQAWSPWLKGGGVLILGLVLWLAYLRADLRTNGYSAGRLRVLFGSLFAAGAGIFWGLPL